MIYLLSDFPVSATLQAQDVERARAFYTDKLGLKPVTNGIPPDIAVFESGGCSISLYKPGVPTSAPAHTNAAFMVKDIEALVEELKGRGVVFEEYDMPGIKTDNGIASFGTMKSAWFKDSEGNVLALNQI